MSIWEEVVEIMKEGAWDGLRSATESTASAIVTAELMRDEAKNAGSKKKK